MKNPILKKILPHAIAVVIFALLAGIYFAPVFSGYAVKQGDIEKFSGMAQEIKNHRETYNEEPLYTNSMFAGMDAQQISVLYPNDFLKYIMSAVGLWLPHPVNMLFLYMLGFYLLLLALDASKPLAGAGAVAYGFSSYFFTLIPAGHNSKAMAVAFLAFVLAGIIWTMKGRWKLGGVITLLFLALELKANHLQVTYYFAFLAIAVYLFYTIRHFVSLKNEVKDENIIDRPYKNDNTRAYFLKTLGVLSVAAVLALFANFANIYGTYAYAKHTMRGGAVLKAKKAEGDKGSEEGSGKLSFNYITQWSYGKGESWSFLVPNVKGGSSTDLGDDPELVQEKVMETVQENPELLQGVDGKKAQQAFSSAIQKSAYWGDQPFTSGPFYTGASLFFLFFMGMLFVKSGLKWIFFAIGIIALMLSWGHNLEGFNRFMVENFPMYGKFRAVTIVLVIVELVLPLIGILWLIEIFREKDYFQKETSLFFGKVKMLRSKLFLYASGVFVLFMLIFAISPSAIVSLKSGEEAASTDVDKHFEYFDGHMVKFGLASLPESFLELKKENFEAYKTQVKENVSKPAVENYKLYNPIVEKSEIRKDEVSGDAIRSLLFVLASIAILFMLIRGIIPVSYATIAFGLIFILDLFPVAKRYMNNEEGDNSDYAMYELAEKKQVPYNANMQDSAILVSEMRANPQLAQLIESEKSKAEQKYAESDFKELHIERELFKVLMQKTHYRVLNLNYSLAGDGRTGFFHKGLGGYHGAKFQRYQDLIDYYLEDEWQQLRAGTPVESMKIINMLNTKYVIGRGENPNNLGAVWFVSNIDWVNTPDEEIAKIGEVDLGNTAVIHQEFKSRVKESNPGDAKISLKSYKANEITYSVEGLQNSSVAVFSEIYYPLGWNAYIDGKKVEHFRVDYLLRGLSVPAGAKEVVFKFEHPTYGWTSTISMASSGLIILIVLAGIYLGFKEEFATNHGG